MELLYLTCPVCQLRIKEPFHAEGGPQAILHRHGRGESARLIAHPARRKVIQVPDDVSMEDALADELTRCA